MQREKHGTGDPELMAGSWGRDRNACEEEEEQEPSGCRKAKGYDRAEAYDRGHGRHKISKVDVIGGHCLRTGRAMGVVDALVNTP